MIEVILTDVGGQAKYLLRLEAEDGVLKIWPPDGGNEPIIVCVSAGVLELRPDPAVEPILISDLESEDA